MSATPVCAIHYHPDAYKADRVGVKGRHSAGSGFLTGLFRHGRAPMHVSVTPNENHAAEFAAAARQRDPQAREIRNFQTMPAAGSAAECLMVPGPVLDEFAWERRVRDQRAYSICGVTHTLASDRIIAGLANFHILPLQPWDALVCTSRVARDVVENAMETYADYLARRTGAKCETSLKLPIIPLGVDGARYAEDQAARQSFRAGIGARDGDFVILFLGRFTFHAKAHPVPMYLAAERAAKRLTDRKVHLVMVGQAPNDNILKLFRSGAETYTDAAEVHFVDGRDDDLVNGSWQGADVFLSLSDNIQETFGLTPIEAMAAGLPSVVSDWDGYKDTIVHGETGFRVPTAAPGSGSGLEFAVKYQTRRDDYDRFVGRACMSTSCDLQATADALVQLAKDPELRARMGEAGRARARTHYDWSVVIRAYEDLWLELRELRASAPEVAPRGTQESPHPLYPDPFAIFAPHPSAVLSADTVVSADPDSDLDGIEDLARHPFCTFSSDLMLPSRLLPDVLARLSAEGPLSVGDMESTVAPELRRHLRRTLPWLAKFGLIKLS
ncbi:glycosyltransferase family 4 protein [Nisaea sediminum]|uniref:glycosyltransferase family 4 protein n=1 Tax=Nisaea sediminum TaxID=2775867 RepID=UPI0018673BDF|nr:glycosyltransferase family 4 protein [Nisaea sediminum]